MFRDSQQSFYAYLVSCSNAYYNTNQPLVSDSVFDQLVDEYEKTYNTRFDYLGSSTHSKVTLPCYMGSLDKHKTDKELMTFRSRFQPSDTYVLSQKMDGISLLYSPSKQRLYTRGDGSVGSNVSHLLEHLRLPTIVQTSGVSNSNIWIRGELVLDKTIPKARNIVAGLVNSKTVDTTLLAKTRFYAYQLINLDDPTMFSSYEETLKYLRQNLFLVPEYELQDSSSIYLKLLSTLFLRWKEECPFDIDGIVIQHNTNFIIYKGRNPMNACAFKIQNATRMAVVKQVIWNESAFQSYHPIVNIEPVDWDGVVIQNCSGFHAQFIVDNKVGPGAVVEMTRSGDVIPDIVSVPQQAFEPQLPSDYIQHPENWYWKSVHLYCKQQSMNGRVVQLTRFFTCVDVPFLKEETIRKILAVYPAFQEYEFLFELQPDMLTSIKGFGAKKIDSIMQALTSCKSKFTIVHLMKGSALFQNMGEKILDKIVPQIMVQIQRFVQSQIPFDTDEIVMICASHSVYKRAQDMVETLPVFCDRYRSLLQFYFSQQAQQAHNSPKHKRKSEDKGMVVFTGFRNKDLKQKAEDCGWMVGDSITKQTKLVVAKDPSEQSSKLQKATQMNIPIITISQFEEQV